jgi:hypothetical protein
MRAFQQPFDERRRAARTRACANGVRVAAVVAERHYRAASRSVPGARYHLRRTPAGWTCECRGYVETGCYQHLGALECRAAREGWPFGDIATPAETSAPPLPLGRVVATRGALDALAAADVAPATLLTRHAAGDWGDISPEDAAENALSLSQGFRVLSIYRVGAARIWVITEADRSSTCLLLPEEY